MRGAPVRPSRPACPPRLQKQTHKPAHPSKSSSVGPVARFWLYQPLTQVPTVPLAGGQFGRDRVRSERPGLVYAVVGSRLRETSGKLAGGQDNRSVIQRSKLLTIKLNVYTTFTLHCCQMWLFICFVWWTLSQSNCIANKYGE